MTSIDKPIDIPSHISYEETDTITPDVTKNVTENKWCLWYHNPTNNSCIIC